MRAIGGGNILRAAGKFLRKFKGIGATKRMTTKPYSPMPLRVPGPGQMGKYPLVKSTTLPVPYRPPAKQMPWYKSNKFDAAVAGGAATAVGYGGYQMMKGRKGGGGGSPYGGGDAADQFWKGTMDAVGGSGGYSGAVSPWRRGSQPTTPPPSRADFNRVDRQRVAGTPAAWTNKPPKKKKPNPLAGAGVTPGPAKKAMSKPRGSAGGGRSAGGGGGGWFSGWTPQQKLLGAGAVGLIAGHLLTRTSSRRRPKYVVY